MGQPLVGVRVLEVATGVAGPYAGKLFADFGADVIKVEPPTGDEARQWRPFLPGAPAGDDSALFLHLNTNKRSVTLDLSQGSEQELFRKLIGGVDICIESFSPGTLLGWGLDVLSLHKINPTLVVTSITPFGQGGPYRDYIGNELTYYAMGGLNFTRAADGRPVVLGGNLSQYQTGNFAASSTLGALLFAEASGEGTHLDISLMATQVSSVNSTIVYLTAHAYNGRTSTPPKQAPLLGQGLGPFPNGMFRCSDGAVSVTTMPAWVPRMLKAVNDSELTEMFTDHAALASPETSEKVQAVVERWFSSRTKREAMLEAQAVGWSVTAIQSPSDLLDDPHFAERKAIIEVDHPAAGRVVQLGAPFRMEHGWQLRRPAPLLGQHNQEVLTEFGLGPRSAT